MKCGKCGSELQNDAAFCGECGTPVQMRDNVQNSYINCPRCNALHVRGTRKCNHCGYMFKAKASNSFIATVVALSLVVALIPIGIGCYIMFGDNNNKGMSTGGGGGGGVAPIVSASPTVTPTQTPAQNAIEEKYPTYYVVNCNEYVSLRETASTSAKVLQEVPLGSPVSYIEAFSNGFAKVVYNGVTGYILQSYLSANASDVNRVSPQKPVQTQPPQNNTSSVVRYPSYLTYNDYDFGFSCNYPSHFELCVINNNFIRYSLRAPDGTAELWICATRNTSGLSPETVRDNFLSTNPGMVDYQNMGDNWCAASSLKDGRWHYCYYRVTSDSIRGFELHYDERYEDIYDDYINDIYDSINFR